MSARDDGDAWFLMSLLFGLVVGLLALSYDTARRVDAVEARIQRIESALRAGTGAHGR